MPICLTCIVYSNMGMVASNAVFLFLHSWLKYTCNPIPKEKPSSRSAQSECSPNPNIQKKEYRDNDIRVNAIFFSSALYCDAFITIGAEKIIISNPFENIKVNQDLYELVEAYA